MSADPPREPPVYRPYALLAFGVTIVAGTPVGLWLLAWIYLGAPAPRPEWLFLHAHLQVVGFFGVLIMGVAPHLLARFTGRAVVEPPAWLAPTFAAALVARLAGVWGEVPMLLVAAAVTQAVVFAVFGGRVWRALEPAPLTIVRRHLGVASAWFALACLAEAVTRGYALAAGHALPDPGMLRATQALGMYGGVTGWILGVLLRAGPMFVPDWRVPPGVARAAPWLLVLGLGSVAAGETASAGRSVALVLAGQAAALAAVALVAVTGGVFRRAPRALPLVTRSAEESRIFRLAIGSAVVALAGSAVAAALPPRGALSHLVEDALRHLVAVGFLTGVVVAMTFRLIPVLASAPLPWPRLRGVAFWALLAAVALRSTEVLVGAGVRELALVVPVSGFLAWLALVCVGANLVRAIPAPRGHGTSRGTGRRSPSLPRAI